MTSSQWTMGGHNEGQSMGAQGKGVALLYGNYILVHIEFKNCFIIFAALAVQTIFTPGYRKRMSAMEAQWSGSM